MVRLYPDRNQFPFIRFGHKTAHLQIHLKNIILLYSYFEEIWRINDAIYFTMIFVVKYFRFPHLFSNLHIFLIVRRSGRAGPLLFHQGKGDKSWHRGLCRPCEPHKFPPTSVLADGAWRRWKQQQVIPRPLSRLSTLIPESPFLQKLSGIAFSK